MMRRTETELEDGNEMYDECGRCIQSCIVFSSRKKRQCEMEKRKNHCSAGWQQKKKHFKEPPLEEAIKHFDYGHIAKGLKKQEIALQCCGSLLKDSPDGLDKILVVCYINIGTLSFKLTRMGTKADDLYNFVKLCLLQYMC